MKLAEFGPGLIHVAGFDTWQGAAVLGLPYVKQKRDGLMLCTESGEPDEFNGEDLLAFLHEGPARPWLVGLNVYNSAARLARWLSRAEPGPRSAFRTSSTTTWLRCSLPAGYNALPEVDPGSGVLQAFLGRRVAPEAGTSLTGSGIVLWSEETIANQRLGPVARGASRIRPGRLCSPDRVRARTRKGRPAASGPSRSTRSSPTINSTIPCFITSATSSRTSYSTKGGPWRGGPSSYHPPELYLGLPSPCSWEQTTDIEAEDEPVLHSKIRLPLISELQRSLKQTLRTNLMVRIEHDGRIYYQETFPVELLAIDEWRDDDMARAWLPRS